jgi:Polyribonucleotide nucleotidyltransferase (polynucleotide phosphorylase)
MSHSVTATIGQSPVTIEAGKLARLADGSVTIRSGETIVLVSAVSATTVKEGQDFFP